MPLYMYQLAYTPESWAAHIKKPENRVETVARAAYEAAGGKLIGGWLSFGDYDAVFIADMPDAESMVGRRRHQSEQDDRADDRGAGRRGAEESRRGRQDLPTREVSETPSRGLRKNAGAPTST
jgi:hypothetical protein